VGTLAGENAALQFSLLEDASGKDTITLLLDGGLEATNTLSFAIEVSDNQPPSLNAIPDMVMIAGTEAMLKLAGITDGDPDADQDISLTAVAGGENVVLETLSYSGGTYASLNVKAVGPDTLENMIIVSDGLIQDTAHFTVTIYESLNNPPVMDPVADVTAFFGSGEKTVNLTGIADGDGTNQQLTITAVSGDETIVPNPIAVNYTEGDNATLVFTPNQAVAGKSVISVTLVDNGGTPVNDGDKSAVYTFVVETRPDPVTGYVVPMTDWETDSASGVWGPEGWGVQFNLAYVDSGDFQSMKIDMKDKWDYAGIWMDLPLELDLTNHPYISYEVYSVDNPTYHWNYLYDEGVDGSIDRNIQNSEEHMFQVPSNKWTLLSFDYSDEGDLNNSAGEPINIARINAVLLNLHNRKGGWPFTNYTGTVYYRNIRLGDQAIVPPKKYSCTMDGVSDQGVYINAGEISIPLTGVSDGQDSTENVTLTAASSDAGIIPAPEITAPDDEGNALLTFSAVSTAGVSVITVKASAPGSNDKTISFRVSLSSDEVGASALVTVDPDQTFQNIQGLGTFQTRSDVADLYLNMGSSAVRLGVIGNQVEWENDNDDPFVLNMEALDRNAWDFDYLRHLKSNGVEKFILTLWSAPAWMKQNLSLDQIEQAIEWENTDNKVEPYYYDEYAENVIATIRLLKDEGIDVYAVCPQNEPAFNEPYPSAILGPNQFRDFIKILGPRLDAEGFDTRIYMPEQVFGIQFYSMDQYISAVKADPVADENTEIIAVHGYADDGITPGEPDYSQWNDMWNAASTGNHPKELWMTETHVGYTGFADALRVAGAMHGGFKYGNISWWTNWSFEDMQLTKLKPNSTYYTSMNYVKYIRPGALRIGSSSSHVDVLETAFYHPEDQTYTIVLINKSMTAVSINLKGDNIPQAYRAFRTSEYMNFEEIDSVRNDLFLLPPNSVTTLYATLNSALTMDAVADQYLTLDAPEQSVNVTGISDGSGGVTGLTLAVSTDNSILLPDLAVSTIDAGGTARVTYTPAADQTGTAKVTLTLSDGTNLPRVVTFYVVVGATGVKESTTSLLRMYPNPADELLYIEIPGENAAMLTVTDVSGRVTEQRQVSGTVVTLDVHHYRSGIYLLQVKSGNSLLISRFMKR
jgi:O-glycosyl hydrolase